MRWLMAFALLAALAAAQDAGKEKPKEAPAAPGPEGAIVKGACDAPALSVRVKDEGVLEIKAGEEWKSATLADVGEQLAKFAEEQDRELKKSGKSAFEQIGGSGFALEKIDGKKVCRPIGAKVCRLFLSIEAEPTAPWQHVRWLMAVAAEQKYRKIQVSDGKRALLVTLPIDAAPLPAKGNPPAETRVVVHAMARAEQPGKWGAAMVNRPTEIRYRFRESEATSLNPVRDYLSDARKAAKGAPNTRLVGEINAGNKVPFANVLDLMETFEAMGIRNMEFARSAPPRDDLRTVSPLPYPLKNYDVN